MLALLKALVVEDACFLGSLGDEAPHGRFRAGATKLEPRRLTNQEGRVGGHLGCGTEPLQGRYVVALPGLRHVDEQP